MYKQIRDEVNAILAEVKLNSGLVKLGWSANWSDLSCTEVLLCTTEFGDTFWQVTIEEADSYELGGYVSGSLSLKFPFLKFEVLTEW
jgi:hypothetical protein